MSAGEYLLALLAIITGLAITDMATSLHGLLVNRRFIRWDWLALAAAALVLVVIANSWGVSYRAFNAETIDHPLWYFLLALASIIPLYLAARAALPDEIEPGQDLDLAAHYASNSRYFWAAIALATLLYLVQVSIDHGVEWTMRERWPTLLYLVATVPLIVWQARSLHRVLLPALGIILCATALPSRMLGP